MFDFSDFAGIFVTKYELCLKFSMLSESPENVSLVTRAFESLNRDFFGMRQENQTQLKICNI